MSAPIVTTSAGKPIQSQGSRWRQVFVITFGAVVLYVIARRLPTGTNLSHMDFRAGANSIEFCDPVNPQFMPVVAVRSPVEMTLTSNTPAVTGREVRVVAMLKTTTGKAIAPEDLRVVHTQKLHLLVIDPTLTDYQHIHPQPGNNAGEWVFTFTPRQAGQYRIFADFTPAATARGLYANADLVVASTPGFTAAVSPTKDNHTYEVNGFIFELRPAEEPLRAGCVIDLTFAVSRRDKGLVPLQPVMGAYAHLVAFDNARSGFAHLHPFSTDLLRAPDSHEPRLAFKLTIPRAGRYVIWVQVKLDGREVFVPFWFVVLP